MYGLLYTTVGVDLDFAMLGPSEANRQSELVFVYRPRTLLLQDFAPEWLSACRHLARSSDLIEEMWNHGDTSHL
jgi:hypothetical protein